MESGSYWENTGFFRKFAITFGILILTTFLASCQNLHNVEQQIQESVSTLPESSHSTTLRITNGPWPPYNGENLPEGGCDTKVVTETFRLMGIDVEYGYFPWARSYVLAESGEWDGSVAWDDTPKILEENWVSAVPTSVQDWVFFYRNDNNFEWHSIEDLYGKTVGITVGYLYAGVFDDLKEDGNINFIENTTDEGNYKMLLAGRIDVFPMERNVGQYIMNEIFTEEEQSQISYTENSFSNFESHLLLTRAIPENEQIMNEFNIAFQQLIKSGKYDEIMDQCNQNIAQ